MTRVTCSDIHTYIDASTCQNRIGLHYRMMYEDDDAQTWSLTFYASARMNPHAAV